ANVYNTRGLLLSTTVDAGGANPETTSYGYDSDGRQVLVTSPMQEAVHFYYDVDGHLVAQTDALGYTSEWIFDADNRVVEAVDNDSNISRSGYDPMGRLLGQEVFAPDGQMLVSSMAYGYDLVGN